MNDEQLFYQAVRFAIFGGVAVLFGVLGSCQLTNYQIRRTVEAGAEPFEAACAMTMGTNNDHTCIIIASTKKRALD